MKTINLHFFSFTFLVSFSKKKLRKFSQFCGKKSSIINQPSFLPFLYLCSLTKAEYATLITHRYLNIATTVLNFFCRFVYICGILTLEFYEKKISLKNPLTDFLSSIERRKTYLINYWAFRTRFLHRMR